MKKSVQPMVDISVRRQELTVRLGRKKLARYPVSTSRFGLGEEKGSFKTPSGRFEISDKIGEGASPETVFKSRRPVKVTQKMLREDDLVMGRILWLEGREEKNANTHSRYIYIHGTNHEDEIGTATSHGCVRMRRADVVELFDQVPMGTTVVIRP
ncbi:MAG TPA: L,D-transpeptidase [Chthoniobacterales bacterium]|jgi:lipoprotein-anchoring transpeptidase ErfK/SrfK|nr:L,D-transpeptidase [Chthoniobacterales bacterium]